MLCKTYFYQEFTRRIHLVDMLLSSSVSIMLKEDPENPKCFTEGRRKDFICFWEEDEERAGTVDQYSFTFTYQ